MNELCQFLIKNLILDFDTDVTHEKVMSYIEEDESELALALKQRLTPAKLDDFLIVLGDCLREHLRNGIDEPRVAQQIRIFTNS